MTQKVEAQALSACPFCQSDDIEMTFDMGERGWCVQCDGCSSIGPTRATEAEAAEAWNRRALSSLPEAPAAGVKALEWEETDERWWGAVPIYGLCYEVRITDRGTTRVRWPENGGWEEFDGDLEAAKAAAQADFETRIRSALLSFQTAAVDVEAVKAASVAVLDILNTEAIVHPKEPSAKRLAERIACAALASQAAVEGAVVTLSRMGWEEQVEGGKLFTATAVFSEPPPWSADVVWKSAPFSLSLAAKRGQG